MSDTETTTQPIASQRLAEIESALDALPHPWRRCPINECTPGYDVIPGVVSDAWTNAIAQLPGRQGECLAEPIVDFIADAPQVVGDLLAEVNRLRAAIRRVETMPLRHDPVAITWFVTNNDLTRALYADDPALAEEAVTAALPGLLGGLRDRLAAGGHIAGRGDEGGRVAS